MLAFVIRAYLLSAHVDAGLVSKNHYPYMHIWMTVLGYADK